MNERIEKLGEQADLLGDFTPTKIPGRYVGYITEEQILKFAELIVRECVGICECEWNGDADTFAASEAYNECADAIKEHFGVKE